MSEVKILGPDGKPCECVEREQKERLLEFFAYETVRWAAPTLTSASWTAALRARRTPKITRARKRGTEPQPVPGYRKIAEREEI